MENREQNETPVSALVNGFIRLWMEFETMLRTELTQIPQTLNPENGDSLNPNHYLTLFFRVSSNLQDTSRPTMGELATKLTLSLSSATRLVDWLEEAGYIKRVGDEADRRVVRVALTESGMALHWQMKGYIEQRVGSILERLPLSQRELLVSLLNQAFTGGEQTT
jgi:DNA-binding MarR family transcriptional regulator